MGARDASAARALNWREWLADAGRFAVRPTFAAQPMARGQGLLAALLVLTALDFALQQGLTTLFANLASEGLPLPARLGRSDSFIDDLFNFLILAPVAEELLFRGWMSGRRGALRFAGFGFAALFLLLFAAVAGGDVALPLAIVAVAVVFAGLVYWGMTRSRDTAVPAWFTRHFHGFVWGSTLLFGLIHLGNYEPLTHPLGVLVVVPPMIGGLLLAYTRTRLGLAAAVAHHAAFNAVWMAGDYGWW